mgnify:CR=1 FL=1
MQTYRGNTMSTKETRICVNCDADMTNWERKDDDGVVQVWEIVSDKTWDHVCWECDPCHRDTYRRTTSVGNDFVLTEEI